RQTPGVSAAQALEQAETARLLEPWLGRSAPVDLLPLPHLVDIRIERADAVALDGLQQRLTSVAPEARLEDHRLWLARLLAASSRLQWVAAAMIVASAAVAAASAALTGGGSIARNAERIALLHALGADDAVVSARLLVPTAAM